MSSLIIKTDSTKYTFEDVIDFKIIGDTLKIISINKEFFLVLEGLKFTICETPKTTMDKLNKLKESGEKKDPSCDKLGIPPIYLNGTTFYKSLITLLVYGGVNFDKRFKYVMPKKFEECRYKYDIYKFENISIALKSILSFDIKYYATGYLTNDWLSSYINDLNTNRIDFSVNNEKIWSTQNQKIINILLDNEKYSFQICHNIAYLSSHMKINNTIYRLIGIINKEYGYDDKCIYQVIILLNNTNNVFFESLMHAHKYYNCIKYDIYKSLIVENYQISIHDNSDGLALYERC